MSKSNDETFLRAQVVRHLVNGVHYDKHIVDANAKEHERQDVVY